MAKSKLKQELYMPSVEIKEKVEDPAIPLYNPADPTDPMQFSDRLRSLKLPHYLVEQALWHEKQLRELSARNQKLKEANLALNEENKRLKQGPAKGGQSKSEAKVAAARQNARKAGRPVDIVFRHSWFVDGELHYTEYNQRSLLKNAIAYSINPQESNQVITTDNTWLDYSYSPPRIYVGTPNNSHYRNLDGKGPIAVLEEYCKLAIDAERRLQKSEHTEVIVSSW